VRAAINRGRRPKLVHFRLRFRRVRFVHSSPPPLQKKLQLRKSELDKKTMFFFETTCIERRNPTGCFQNHSGMEEVSVHKSNPKMYSTVRPLQRAGGQYQTRTLWSRTKLTKNYTSGTERKKCRCSKNTKFCDDFTKSIISWSLSLGQITRKCK
jgi:hypothetical protein